MFYSYLVNCKLGNWCTINVHNNKNKQWILQCWIKFPCWNYKSVGRIQCNSLKEFPTVHAIFTCVPLPCLYAPCYEMENFARGHVLVCCKIWVLFQRTMIHTRKKWAAILLSRDSFFIQSKFSFFSHATYQKNGHTECLPQSQSGAQTLGGVRCSVTSNNFHSLDIQRELQKKIDADLHQSRDNVSNSERKRVILCNKISGDDLNSPYGSAELVLLGE